MEEEVGLACCVLDRRPVLVLTHGTVPLHREGLPALVRASAQYERLVVVRREPLIGMSNEIPFVGGMFPRPEAARSRLDQAAYDLKHKNTPRCRAAGWGYLLIPYPDDAPTFGGAWAGICSYEYKD